MVFFSPDLKHDHSAIKVIAVVALKGTVGTLVDVLVDDLEEFGRHVFNV